MTFVTVGLAIAGLVAMGVPIAIHLLSRRKRRPIEWAAMRFLMEAFRKHRRRLQLEQMLLLALRCLILAVLGLALARPMLEASGLVDLGGSRTVMLVIDNGMTSGVKDVMGDEERTALDAHLDQAVRLVESLDVGDTVAVITTARPASALLLPPSGDRGAVVDLLRSLEPAEAPTDLAMAMSVLEAALETVSDESDQTLVYLLSDFRAGSAALDSALPALSDGPGAERTTFLATSPASTGAGNVQIVSLDPVRRLVLGGASDGSGQLTVRLARSGDELGRDVSRVRITGQGIAPVEPRAVTWEPGQDQAAVEYMVRFNAEGERAVALTAQLDDDALAADNQRHVVLDVRERVRVALIDRRSFAHDIRVDQLTTGQWLHRALAPTEGGAMDIVEIETAALDDADLRIADVAILARPDLLGDDGWGIVRRFVDGGGLLLLVPPSQINVHQWTERIGDDLALPWQIDREVRVHEEGLLLAAEQPSRPLTRMITAELPQLTQPIVCFRVLPVTADGGGEPIMTFADGTPLLIASAPQRDEADAGTGPADDRGLVVYLAVAPHLSWTNLPSKPLLLPLIQEIVREGLTQVRAQQNPIVGDRPALALERSAATLIGPTGAQVSVDRVGRPVDALVHAGVYDVVDGAEQVVGQVAVNVDPVAGRTDVQRVAAVGDWLGRSAPWELFAPEEITRAVQRAASMSPLGRALLWILIVLVVLETMFARWVSHAFRGRSGGLRGTVDGVGDGPLAGGAPA